MSGRDKDVLTPLAYISPCVKCLRGRRVHGKGSVLTGAASTFTIPANTVAGRLPTSVCTTVEVEAGHLDHRGGGDWFMANSSSVPEFQN